jgi:hypothetical protein
MHIDIALAVMFGGCAGFVAFIVYLVLKEHDQ